jgi:integrase
MDLGNIAGLDLPEGKGDHIYFDDELPGFGYRLRRSGQRILRRWVLCYASHGRSRRLLIGDAAVLTPAQARKAARSAKAKVTLGGDPQGEKVNERLRSARSLRAAIDVYLTAKDPEWRKATRCANRRYLTGPYFRPLHPVPINDITRADVAARVRAITKANGNAAAGFARTSLHTFFAWAMGEGLAEQNPVIGTNRPPSGKTRERVLGDRELALIWHACGDDEHGRIIRLLILLGARRQEVGGMRWSEIDIARAVWTIAASRSKNHRAHSLSLPAMAMDIIESVPKVEGRDHLFGAWAECGFTRWGMDKAALDERLGGSVAPWRVHDLRRSVATGMATLGVEPHHVEAVLNHFSGHRSGVAGIYNRASYLNQIRAALALWADHVRSITEGTERRVVAFERRVEA